MTLKKQDLTYLCILHMVWHLVDYYSAMFGIDAYESPQDIPCDIFEEDGKTVLRFSFPYIPIDKSCSVTDMADIMQDYLQYCLLPEQTELEPYQGDADRYELVEPIHVSSVRRLKTGYEIDIIYVDNPTTFRYIKTHYGLLYAEGD